MRRSQLLAAAVLALITLTGCVDHEATPDIAFGTDAPHTEAHDDGEVAVPAEASAGSQRSALTAAATVLAAFAQPQLDYPTWWAQLLPLLSQQAGVAYEGTDPAEVPASRITGTGVVLEGSTEVSLIVQLPTDAGAYNVTLIRSNADAPWLADRVLPAQG